MLHNGTAVRVTLCVAVLMVTAVLPFVFAAFQSPREILGGHIHEADTAFRILQDVFGPLPILAVAPFLGLAGLSATALLSDSGYLSDPTLRENALLREAKKYASPRLVVLFLVLALLIYLANSGKVQGIPGKLLRVFEDGSAYSAYVLLMSGALTFEASGTTSQAVVRSGMFDFAGGLAAAVLMGLPLAAMMTVRFACDLVVWLIPIPFIDWFFETGKKVFSVAFLMLYLANPAVAAVASLLIFVLALLVLGWSTRLIGFAWGIVLNPILSRILPFVRPGLTDPYLASRWAVNGQPARVTAPVFALKASGFKKRQRGILIVPGAGSTPMIWAKRLARPGRERQLLSAGDNLSLGRASFWLELRVVTASGHIKSRFAISRALLPRFETLRVVLDAEDAGNFGVAKVFGAVKRVGRRKSTAVANTL